MAQATLLFDFSTTPAEPPTSSQIRFNALDYAIVTKLWVRYGTTDGRDVFYALTTIPTGAPVFVQDKNDHTQIVKFQTTAAAVDKATHVEIPVVWQASGSAPLSNNQGVLLVILDPPAAVPAPPSSYVGAGCGVDDVRATITNKSVLVTPPAVEPLTLDDAKLRAGLTWPAGDPRDAQMHLFIRAARERVERDTGYALLTQTRDVYLSHLVIPPEFPAPARPLQSITTITAPGGAPLPVTDPIEAAQLYPWVYRIVVGWPTVVEVPPLLQWAVGLLTAHYATAARDVVAVGAMASEIPLGYEDAIYDFRRVAV